jgi:TonB-dependent SusC/RagA subfamily outer membrane receptor
MEQLLIYLFKSALYTMLFAGIYWLFLKNETFYRFNRYFLLTGLACAVLLPFYTYTYEVKLMPVETGLTETGPVAAMKDSGLGWTAVLLMVYAAGVCFLLIRHAMGLGRIRQTALKYKYTILKGCKIIETSVFKSSFSVFNYIIIDSSSATSALEKKLILEHELAHVKQHHWADLLICQLFCAVQWFNPLAWIYLHIVKQNHEFLADQAVLQQGNSAAVYRAALINHSLGTPVFALASSFSHYDKLKRVKMMMRPASAAIKKFAAVLVFPALAFFLWAFAKPQFIVMETAARQKLQLIKQDTLAARHAVVTSKAVLADKKQPRPALSKFKRVVTNQEKPVKEQAVVSGPTASVQDSVEKIKGRPLMLSAISAKSEPLYLLDGIEINYNLLHIKPEDIESIHVLKNAAAIDAYGEKGRNGVIRITSKKSGFQLKTGPRITE